MITICGRLYAAALVDLPCVIKGMKSWDRRGWWKSVDICQMLWVFAPIKEEEAKTILLPKLIDPDTFQYPHGLTPPIHYARKRRFRKCISRTAIEAIEDTVEKILEEDAQAISTRWEMINPDVGSRRTSRAFSSKGSEGVNDVGRGEYSEHEDTEEEVEDRSYFGNMHCTSTMNAFDQDIDADLEADLEAALRESMGTTTPLSTLATTLNVKEEEDEEDNNGDKSLEGDEDGDDEAGNTLEIDEDEKARLAQYQGAREDIVELERQLASVQAQLAIQVNPIL
jgi:transcription initiation factor TFIID subunit 7